MFKGDARDAHKYDNNAEPRLAVQERVQSYISHDMVFIPINITDAHWYLAVLNGRKRELKGIQMQIDYVSRYNELNDHSWPDLQVASWPWREIQLNDATQSDNYSCGLFMLNYMEYWTGDKLSDNFTQADMTHFREKIAAILPSSDLNQRKGQPLYKKVDPKEKRDAVGSDPEVQIVGASSSPNKRIRLPDPKTAIFEDDAGPVTQELLQKWVDEEWSKPSTDGSADDKLMSGLSTIDMPPTKADLIDVVCDYIMEIKDDKTLKTVWVRSFNPYRIDLSVLQLQQILKMSQDMTIPCFDMAVRLLAHKEQKKLENAKGKKMSGFNKDPRWHKEPSKEELAKTLDSWPRMNYNVTSCRYVLMPWKNDGCYVLFVIDHANHVITIIDFTHTPPLKRYYEAIILISKKYRTAYRLKHSEWPRDVYKWEHIIRPNRPIDTEKLNTSYLALQMMEWWGCGLKMHPCMDGKTL
ncbi:hypothetical protein U9M48_027320 [Paspalum notatum var. saurae]|uniref:Ubiquitin-like protease family profile domain-containing protein n=1 Tax=Paspalum notatum var. saurae TaxID=547442 RepID=A0AAQ3WZC3_PASNO